MGPNELQADRLRLSKGIEKQLSTQLAKGDVSIARIAESLEACVPP